MYKPFMWSAVWLCLLTGCVERGADADAQRQPMETLMGTNRSWEHLQECYMVGSIDDIVARLKFLESQGLEHVTIQPAAPEMTQLDLWMEKIILPHFR